MKLQQSKLKNWQKCSIILTLLLSACATAPSAPPPCPTRPELSVRVPVGESFQEKMQNFLYVKLPEPTPLEPDLKPVIRHMTGQ